MKRGWLRDSDSKYVRLAKLGGRKDLLSMRSPPPKPDAPKPYPRVDWFDHHVEEEPVDTSPRKVYLPDYMVHEEYTPEKPQEDELSGKRQPPRRPPYSLQDNISAFQRDGDSVTDKTVKLDEDVPYSKRFAKKDKKRDVEQMNKALAARRDSSGQNQKNTIMQEPTEPVIFGKLLSMGYQRDWNDQREKYYDQQRSFKEKQPSYKTQAEANKNKDPVTTEYREEINKKGKQLQTIKAGKRSDTKSKLKQSIKDENSNMLKTKRFHKIHSKVDTHWSPGWRNDTYKQQLEMTKVDI